MKPGAVHPAVRGVRLLVRDGGTYYLICRPCVPLEARDAQPLAC